MRCFLVRSIFLLLVVAWQLTWAGCKPSDSANNGDATRTPSDAESKNQQAENQPAKRRKISPARRMLRARQSFLNSQFAECETELRTLLAEVPDHSEAIRTLALLLNTEGRRWESGKYTFQLLELKAFTTEDLVLLGTPEEPFEEVPTVEAALAADTNDPRPGTGLVLAYRRENRTGDTLALLRRIVGKFPNDAKAQAQLGLLLLDMKLENDFLKWQAELPKETHKHPMIWNVFGAWAQRHGQLDSASRCYWEAVRRAPDQRTSSYDLGFVLNKLNQADASKRFLERSQTLAELEKITYPIYKKGATVEAVSRAAQLTETMGRLWEAWGWQALLLNLEPDNADALAASQRLQATLKRDRPPRFLESTNLTASIDLSHYPLPRFPTPSTQTKKKQEGSIASVSFPDVAAEAGITFRYFDSWVAAKRELMLLETIGGGVAVLDYDNDGWPDLYFAQCCEWPVDLSDQSQLDRLYRNLGNGKFQDVTLECGIYENGYTQGVASGDFDNDGWPDLYTANVGQNRLWHNNGDGTFSLVHHYTDDRLIWTVSAAIADVNGDSLPDIFDANYLVGEGLYTRHCIVEGHPRSCGPTLFDGEHDCLYLNSGDGTFRNVSQQAGLNELAGMGLGIIVADFDRSGQIQIYVSNDVMANYFLVNQASAPGSVPQFTDDGTITGTAFDRAGRSQASMGIACDDVDGDALLDILIGNYYNDCNTLYIQQPGRLFSDETYEFGLRDPSFQLLTFGAQMLDGDLDGYPDLTIANGHVDDFGFRGQPWHMRPQYFRNVQGKQFVELPAAQAGNYYDKTYLGRGVALVDWNRDGHEEFAVSNIADTASLTVNRTETTGHWLAIRLRGVQSARDAIATEVAVAVGGRIRTRQLVGGSGFEASNQKQLVFGLGTATQVDTMRVTWPSGTEQTFTDLKADHEYLLIEGNAQIYPLPRDP